MAYPEEEDYDNLRLDMETIAAVTNSAPDAPDVVSRLGRVIKPLAKVMAAIFAKEESATASAELAGHLANDNTDTDVPGAPAGTRGAKWWNGLVQTAAAAINAKLVLISTRSGYLWVITDSNNNIVGGIRTDGTFETASSGNIDSLLATALSKTNSVVQISTRSGYLWVVTDGANNVIIGCTTAGHIVDGMGQDLSQFVLDQAANLAAIATATSALFPTADIYGVGDSLMENWASMAATLGALFTALGQTRVISRYGLGGQVASQILGRIGGRLALITFPTGASGFPEIPASGAVNVTIDTGILNHPGSANVEAQNLSGAIQIGAGVAGTLTRLAGGTTYQFTRTTAGSIIKVPAKVPFVPNLGTNRKKTLICWMPTNDMMAGSSAATMFAQIEEYIAAQQTREKRVIIIMPHWNMGSTSYRANYDALLALLLPKYGHCVIDTISLLQPLNDGSANDLADIAAGLIPRSLQGGDRIHFPDGGTAYGAIAQEIVNVTVRNGWN